MSLRLVYDVKATDPRVLSGLTRHDVKGRDPALPLLYLYTSGVHPQLRNSTRTVTTGNVYVYLVDPSPQGSAHARDLASTMQVPLGLMNQPGGNPGLLGLIDLQEGDVVFARDITKRGKAEEDALQILIATEDRDLDVAAKRRALAEARDAMFGPRDTRDNRRVWFEEQDRASAVSGDNRCYGLSNMVERQMNASGPPAALKVIDRKLDATQLAVKEMVRADMDYSMTMWTRMAPQSLQIILESYAELINTPRIGTYANHMWSSVQLNLSEPQHFGEEQSLGTTNGRFGASHVDSGDSPTHLSSVTVVSDIPEGGGWEPGRTHFLASGFYTVLHPYKQFYFSGLQRHGSTRPLVPDGLPIPKWACRGTLIGYPPKAMVLGKVSHCFSMMVDADDEFFLTAHSSGGPHKLPPGGHYFTGHTTIAQDGTSSMDDEGLMNFLARGLLLWAYDVMEQVPTRLRVEIDKEQFLGAFKFRSGTNQRIGLRPWPMAPCAKVNDRYEDRHVDAQVTMLKTLYNRMAACIPGLGPSTFEDEYLTNRGSKTRPSSYKLPTKRLAPLPPYNEFNSQPLPARPKRVKRGKRRVSTNAEGAEQIGDGIHGEGRSLRKRVRRSAPTAEVGRSTLRRSTRQEVADDSMGLDLAPSHSSVVNVEEDGFTPTFEDSESPFNLSNSNANFDGADGCMPQTVTRGLGDLLDEYGSVSSIGSVADDMMDGNPITPAQTSYSDTETSRAPLRSGGLEGTGLSSLEDYVDDSPLTALSTDDECSSMDVYLDHPDTETLHQALQERDLDGSSLPLFDDYVDNASSDAPSTDDSSSSTIENLDLHDPSTWHMVPYFGPPDVVNSRPAPNVATLDEPSTPPTTSRSRTLVGVVLPPTPESNVKKNKSGSLTLTPRTRAAMPETAEARGRRLARIGEFCESLRGDVFDQEIRNVVYAVSHLHETAVDRFCRTMAILDNYDNCPEPLRMHPDNLSNYMTAFSVAKIQQANIVAWTSIMRHRIILHEHTLAKTVLEMETVLCHDIFERGTFLKSPTNWIENLLRDIHVKLVIKKPMILTSRSYLQNPGMPDVIYTEPKWAFKERSRFRNRPTEQRFSQVTATYFGRVLREWFGLSSSFLMRGRAQLVDVLLAKFGPGALYLELVETLHSTLPRYLFLNPPHDYHSNQLNKDRPYDAASMDDFVNAIQAVPSRVVADAKLLSEVTQSFIRMAQAYSFQLNDKAALKSTTHGTEPSLCCGIYDRRRNLAEMFKDNLTVLDAEHKVPLSSTQILILEQPDARICFREYAPSRRIMMEHMDEDFMRTRSGFFTALIFRNILFNSEAFLTRPKVLTKCKFEDLDDWTAYLDALHASFPGRSSDFFCNRGAFGQPIRDRKIEHASHFWDTARICEWPKASDWPLSFSDMHALLWRIKNKHGLPGCGALGMYLLCADMVYYSLVTPPTREEISGIIIQLDMGALAGLELLGYLKPEDREARPSPPYPTELVATAAEHFLQDSHLLLALWGASYISIGYIDVEHILCKFSRLWNLEQYRVAPST